MSVKRSDRSLLGLAPGDFQYPRTDRCRLNTGADSFRVTPLIFQYPRTDRCRLNVVADAVNSAVEVTFSILERIDVGYTFAPTYLGYNTAGFQYPRTDRCRLNGSIGGLSNLA